MNGIAFSGKSLGMSAIHIEKGLQSTCALLYSEDPIRSELHNLCCWNFTAQARKGVFQLFCNFCNAASRFGDDLVTSIFRLVPLSYALDTAGPGQRHINRGGLGSRVVQKAEAAPTAPAAATACLPVQRRRGSASARAVSTATCRFDCCSVYVFVLLCLPGRPGAVVHQRTRARRELEKDAQTQEWCHGLHAAAAKTELQSWLESAHLQGWGCYPWILAAICILCHRYEKTMGSSVSTPPRRRHANVPLTHFSIVLKKGDWLKTWTKQRRWHTSLTEQAPRLGNYQNNLVMLLSVTQEISDASVEPTMCHLSKRSSARLTALSYFHVRV